MSVIEIAGPLGSVSLAISALQAYQSTLSDNIRDYGYMRGFALETTFFQARNIVGRIRRHVVGSSGNGAKEAWSVKESYTTTFNMIAVAGAIVAQIAITALSLEYLEATHWTATAAFVVSLVAGLLSVYFACILQQQLSALHDPDEVKRWLTMVQRKRKRMFQFESKIELSIRVEDRANDEYIIPSYNAALLLVLPSILLNWSSIALLIGIGIYYGIVHTENLSSVRGENSSLAILLVYVLFTLGASASYMLPWLQKQLESTAPVQQALQQLYRDEPRTPPPPPHFVSAEPHDSSPADCTGQSVRFDLLRTGGVRHLGRPTSGQDELPTTSRTLRPPSSGPDHDPVSNGNHQHDASLPTALLYAPAVTPAFVAALNASIAAQTASLRAHELLRSELRGQQSARPSIRRGSF